MESLFVDGLNNCCFYDEVSSSLLKSGLTGEGAITLLEKEFNARLSALQVEFSYVSSSCVACTFITPSEKFHMSLSCDNFFDFICEVSYILIAYSLGKGYKADF